MARRWRCPRCHSTDLVRLPASRISPEPGYNCEGCGVRLRAPGTWFMYAMMLFVCPFLVVLYSLPIWDARFKGQIPMVSTIVIALVVAFYSVRQLARPVVCEIKDQQDS